MSTQACNQAQLADSTFVWHPFTKLKVPESTQPATRILQRGEGSRLWDVEGRVYYDGNSSIWTCLHGHGHPALIEAVTKQISKLDHVSALGLGNEQAAQLAAELCAAMSPVFSDGRVMFCSDGSSAVEAALKMLHLARRLRGEPQRQLFLRFGGAYHGDTIGAMSVSHSTGFHHPFCDLMFQSMTVPTPACYRCPHNKAQPERGVDARQSRRCEWECLAELEAVVDSAPGGTVNALWAESLVQGAAGFVMQPQGYLRQASELLQQREVWLACDEILTGSGRCGPVSPSVAQGARPQVVALGKSLSGGVLPLAATVVSREIAQLYEQPQATVFYHGHSYSGNPPACAAALASLQLLSGEHNQARQQALYAALEESGKLFWQHPNVGDVRQEGGILAVEIVQDFINRNPFPPQLHIGTRVCEAAVARGLLTRPVGDVLVLMPPLCTTADEVKDMAQILFDSLCEVLPSRSTV